MHAEQSDIAGRNKDVSVDALQGFLRAELAAVETYELALTKIMHVGVRHSLQEILTSHERRAEMIRSRVASLGTEPAQSSGAWGALAKTMQAGADLLGDRLAIAALEQGEEHGLSLYMRSFDDVDWGTQKFVESELLPEQRRTQELCRALETYTKAPS
jgi:demethoxyubiquinone hydroxylase (CLK1/Coq7/Cat5 family)